VPKGALLTLKLEPQLREDFMKAAANIDRPASQILREFIHDFIARQNAEQDQNEWMRLQIENAVSEADDPKSRWIDENSFETRVTAHKQALLLRLKGEIGA
jgi:predicted transcriptional regulator